MFERPGRTTYCKAVPYPIAFIVNPKVVDSDLKYTVDEILERVNLERDITDADRLLVRRMLSTRRRLFSDELGWAHGMRQEIKIKPGAEPPNEQVRRLAPPEYAALKKEVDKQLRLRLITPIVSPFSAAPMVIAKPPKADGTIDHRVVLDFRRLNEICERDNYPLPRVDDNLAKLGRAKLFTTADLLMGFHQVELTPESIPATAFSTPWGQFAYTRMPMGLTSSPSAFMRVVDATLRGLPQNIALAYCDDIIVFTDGDMEQHMADVGAVFDKLIEGGFTVRCDKVHIGKREVPYLGFTVGAFGTKPQQSKTQPILDMCVSACQRSSKAASRFAGMIGVYQRFIPACHEMLAPFHELRNKNADHPVQSRKLRFLAAFAALKHALCNLTALSRPDLSKVFYVDADAAATGAASAVLSQRLDEADPHSHVPIAFWSTRFSDVQRGWSIRELECFALHGAMMEWRRYLLQGRVIVRTDHQSLRHLLSGKLREGGRITDMAMDLRGFDAHIQWVAGKEHLVADTLTRAAVAAPLPAPDSCGDGGSQGFATDGTGASAGPISLSEGGAKRGATGDTEALYVNARTAERTSALFVQPTGDGYNVFLERHGNDVYSLPAVAIDATSNVSCRGQLSAYLCKQYGQDNVLSRSLLQNGARLRLQDKSPAQTRVFVVTLPSGGDVSVSPSFATAAGQVLLTPKLAATLEHCDDSSSLAFLENLLQDTSLGNDSTVSQNVEIARQQARRCWRLSCIPSVKARLDASKAANPIVSTLAAESGLPNIHEAPHGPAFCQSLTDTAKAVEAMIKRLSSSSHPAIAVDLEGTLGGNRLVRRHIALLQVCIDGVEGEPPLIYVFDTHTTKSLLRASGDGTLRSLFEDNSIVKVFHCCHGDAASLFEEYGIVLRNAFDTAIADSLLSGVHHNKNRSLKTVLLAYLGEEVVKLEHKGHLIHEVGMFEPRPLAFHLFVYAYEDVLYLVRAYLELKRLLEQRGIFELWGALSALRCPPFTLSSSQFTRPTKIVVAVTDGTGALVLRDPSTDGVSLPCGELSLMDWKNGPSSYRVRARQIWQHHMGNGKKGSSGLRTVVNARLQKSVRIGDTLLIRGTVASCSEALSDLREFPTEEHTKPDVIAADRFGSSPVEPTQRVLFEYLALAPSESSTTDVSVVIGPTHTKFMAAVIVHDRENVVTICKKTSDQPETFPSMYIEVEGEGRTTATNALCKYLGPSLLKGGEGSDYTTSPVLLPIFSKVLQKAVNDLQYVGTFGNTEYYSCALPDVTWIVQSSEEGTLTSQPALSIHASAFAASRREINGYRLTDTEQKRCAGTSIRPFAQSLPLLRTTAGYDAAALAAVLETVLNAPSAVPAVQSAACSQHSELSLEEDTPFVGRLGADEEYDRLFEAAFCIKVGQLLEQHDKEAVCFGAEGISEMPLRPLPTRLRIRLEQRAHPAIRKFIDYLLEGEGASSFVEMGDKEKAEFKSKASEFGLTRDGLLVKRATGLLNQPRIWLPPCLIRQICRAYHDRLGHQGVSATTALILERYTWGENDGVIRKKIREHILNCAVCRRAKVPHHKAGCGHIMSTGEHPYDVLAADVYKTGIKSKEGFDTILSFACYFSRHISALATCGDPSSSDIVAFLINDVIRHYGMPSEIRSDHASVFVSRAIKLLYARYGIRVADSTAYHHRTIGLVERWHSCCKSLLLTERFSAKKKDADSWQEYLPLLVMAFNSTVNQTTGFSPFFVIHGRHCRLPFDSVIGSSAKAKELPDWVCEQLERLGVVYDAVARKLKLNAIHRKRTFDLKRDVTLKFRPGDRVLLLKGTVVDKTITKREFATEGPYLGPFTVQRALERDNYLLCDLRTRRLHDKVHVERLVPYPSVSAREMESNSDYYSIRSIVGRRVVNLPETDRALGIPKGTPTLQYRVRWAGFSPSSDTWLHPSYLGNIKHLVDAFDKKNGGPVEGYEGISRDAAVDLPPDDVAKYAPRFRGHALRVREPSPEETLEPEAPTSKEAEVNAPSRETRAGIRRSSRLAPRAALGEISNTPEVKALTARISSWLFNE